MAKMLLTTIESWPVVIKCEKVSDIEKFKKKNSVLLSASTWEKNKHKWVQDVDPSKEFLADLINKYLGNYECWIRKEDADDEVI